MGYLKSGLIAVSVCAMVAAVAFAEEKDPTIPRVPGDQRGAAKAMKNPIPKTPENIAKGKAIYEGKGTCFNCHGLSGKGDGPAGVILNPSPRNFTNPKFHKNRTDGEMFQPGLAMNTYCGGRSSRPARLFSLGLLDVPQGTPASSSLPRSHGGLRSQPPRYGIPG